MSLLNIYLAQLIGITVLIKIQLDATVGSLISILLQSHSTCFGCPQHPSSGVLKTVSTASSAGHIGSATSVQHGHVGGK